MSFPSKIIILRNLDFTFWSKKKKICYFPWIKIFKLGLAEIFLILRMNKIVIILYFRILDESLFLNNSIK